MGSQKPLLVSKSSPYDFVGNVPITKNCCLPILSGIIITVLPFTKNGLQPTPEIDGDVVGNITNCQLRSLVGNIVKSSVCIPWILTLTLPFFHGSRVSSTTPTYMCLSTSAVFGSPKYCDHAL